MTGQDSGAEFQRACAAAVAQSRPVAARLREMVERLSLALQGDRPAGPAADEVGLLTGRTGATLRGMVTDQLAEIGTFNVVFFGRTGAGKSTLITALGRGDGTLISPGDNDFTTEVGALLWQGSRLVDTPGTGGWGRTVDAAELHERARAAVRTADLVLLCFDDTVTQITEFAEISRWVAEYGKQAIAVLNIKNALWRQPPRVPDPAFRRQLSDAVAQSALWLQGQLSEIGLPEVPIVAVNSRRAAFARLPETYDGYDAATFRKHRRDYGVDNLMAWSHVSTLEGLMTRAITTDAVGLRLGSLSRQLVSEASAGARALTDLAADLRSRAVIVEKAVAEVLWLFGDSRQLHQAAGAQPFSPQAAAVLADLEELQRRSGQTIFSSRPGVVVDFVANLQISHFGPLERVALRRAEVLVDDAYAHNRMIDTAEFASTVFRQAEMEQAVAAVATAFTTHLRHRLEAVEANLRVDLAPTGASFDGSAGKGLRLGGNVVRYGSAMAAAGTIVFPPMALVGIVGDIIGRRFRKKGLIRQRESRAAALAQARTTVHAHFLQLSQEVRERLLRLAFDQVVVSISELVRAALALREQERRAVHQARLLTDFCAEVGPTGLGQHAVATAVASIEAEYAATGRPGRRVWLGDDWVDEVVDDRGGDTGHDIVRPFPAEHRVVAARVAQTVRRSRPPAPRSAEQWLRAWSSDPDDPDAEAAVAQLRLLHAEQAPRVAVIGDRGTGKTALIRRMAQLTGARVHIEPGPTGEVHAYPWEGVTLVDTPPLGADGRAMEAVRNAAFIWYVLSPNLTATPYLAGILAGDPQQGMAPRADRVVFVIGHADVMGADPVDSPEEFVLRCRRKEAELLSEVHRLQGPGDRLISSVQVVCLAPDPVTGSGSPADWDGTADFADGWRSARAWLIPSGIDAGVLLGAVARMTVLHTQAAAAQADLDEETASLTMLQADLRLRWENAIALRAAAVDRLDWIITGALRTHLDQWDKALDKEEQAAIAQQILKMDQRPDMQAYINQWAAAAQRQVEHWAQDMATFDPGGTVPHQRDPRLRLQARFLQRATETALVGKAGSAVSALAKLKSVGRLAGEGSKVASRFLRIAPFVPLLATTAEDLFSAHSRKRREGEREQGEAKLFDDARRWVTQLVEAHPGLSWLQTQGELLGEAIGEASAELHRDAEQIERIKARLSRYEQARQLAIRLLEGDHA
ncbi:GTP-binding protein EngB required for normal cell division [Allocatelliglobosispora scoriae]|uniref:GTP-binding protein EngB required for normal cell division n=1 Tax=Allocatelliglobosispora scoriae TaxID=643052 RepID=A0A841BLU1_9ACTN|nr:GTPase [Allocatelliglobosispora scoriae]MBB5867790.1 GTP-binding protein EngB required for normal cell division [Allocatelliglobosispora scoriae]